MKKIGLLLIAGLLACGGNSVTPPPVGKPKPDPYVTVRVRNMLDTTTAVGRAHWHLYALLTAPEVRLDAISGQGAISLQDVRTGHSSACIRIAADSVGERFLATVAVADTTTENLTPDATADSVIASFYAGARTLPAGWDALFITPRDAWNSVQYDNGHGLIPSDPIKWGWDWTGSGATSFYERTDTDICDSFYF